MEKTAIKVHRLKRYVYYCDTDAAGVVYYGNYPRLIEIARTEMWRKLGVDLKEVAEQHGLQFAVTDLNIRYRKPAFYGDELTIETRVTRINPRGVSMEQDIFSNRFEGRPIVSCKVELVIVGPEFKSARLPEEILSKLR